MINVHVKSCFNRYIIVFNNLAKDKNKDKIIVRIVYTFVKSCVEEMTIW